MLVCDFGVTVFLRTSKDCMASIRGPMMTVTRCVSLSVVIVCNFVVIRQDINRA